MKEIKKVEQQIFSKAFHDKVSQDIAKSMNEIFLEYQKVIDKPLGKITVKSYIEKLSLRLRRFLDRKCGGKRVDIMNSYGEVLRYLIDIKDDLGCNNEYLLIDHKRLDFLKYIEKHLIRVYAIIYYNSLLEKYGPISLILKNPVTLDSMSTVNEFMVSSGNSIISGDVVDTKPFKEALTAFEVIQGYIENARKVAVSQVYRHFSLDE